MSSLGLLRLMCRNMSHLTKGFKNLKGDILKAASAKRIRSNQKNRVSDSDAHFMVCSAGALAVDTLHAEWLFEFQR